MSRLFALTSSFRLCATIPTMRPRFAEHNETGGTIMAVYKNICAYCGYRWTIVAGVSRSWWCPECRRLQTRPGNLACDCGHVYGEHRTSHPANKDPKRKPLGSCDICACAGYRPTAEAQAIKGFAFDDASHPVVIFDIANAKTFVD